MSKKTTYQFSMSGKLLNTYSSVKEASRELNIDSQTIALCARKDIDSVGGYVFSYTPEFSPGPCKPNRRKTVYQFSQQGELLNTYPSVSNAAKKLKLRSSSISLCARGVRRLYDGYVFSYTPNFVPRPKKERAGQTIYQFSRQGELLNTFPSVKSAAQKLNLNYNAISLCARGNSKSCGGYIFNYTPSFVPRLPQKPHKGRCKTIYQFSKQGELLNTFPSVRAASTKLNLSASAISMCAIGRHKTCGGYIFSFNPARNE